MVIFVQFFAHNSEGKTTMLVQQHQFVKNFNNWKHLLKNPFNEKHIEPNVWNYTDF